MTALAAIQTTMLQIETAEIRDDKWLSESKTLVDKTNIICLTKDEFKSSSYNPLLWFATNLASFLAKGGDAETCPFFGRLINSIDDFTYQLCRAIPWGFEMGQNLDAVYDVVLNFTTEPKSRYFIWHDAQHLFRTNRELFEGIFECLIVASYLNSNGVATQDYRVNQKVIFLFDNTDEEEIKELCHKKYYTPSIYGNYDGTQNHEIEHYQEMVLIK